jgi:hypothetical protein
MTVESFIQVLHLDIITEVIILDDHSDINMYEDLERKIENINSNKIKLFRNEINKKAFLNKLDSVKKSSNDWVILLDSDNVITTEYIDSIPSNIRENIFYLPSRAICENDFLNYNNYSNMLIDKEEFKKLAKSADPKIQCLLNTGNYFFNKHTYIKSIEYEKVLMESYAVDCFYQIYLGFKNIENFSLYVVPGMQYFHRLHDSNSSEQGSYYVSNSQKSSQFLNYLQNNIKEI